MLNLWVKLMEINEEDRQTKGSLLLSIFFYLNFSSTFASAYFCDLFNQTNAEGNVEFHVK